MKNSNDSNKKPKYKPCANLFLPPSINKFVSKFFLYSNFSYDDVLFLEKFYKKGALLSVFYRDLCLRMKLDHLNSKSSSNNKNNASIGSIDIDSNNNGTSVNCDDSGSANSINKGSICTTNIVNVLQCGCGEFAVPLNAIHAPEKEEKNTHKFQNLIIKQNTMKYINHKEVDGHEFNNHCKKDLTQKIVKFIMNCKENLGTSSPIELNLEGNSTKDRKVMHKKMLKNGQQSSILNNSDLKKSFMLDFNRTIPDCTKNNISEESIKCKGNLKRHDLTPSSLFNKKIRKNDDSKNVFDKNEKAFINKKIKPVITKDNNKNNSNGNNNTIKDNFINSNKCINNIDLALNALLKYNKFPKPDLGYQKEPLFRECFNKAVKHLLTLSSVKARNPVGPITEIINLYIMFDDLKGAYDKLKEFTNTREDVYGEIAPTLSRYLIFLELEICKQKIQQLNEEKFKISLLKSFLNHLFLCKGVMYFKKYNFNFNYNLSEECTDYNDDSQNRSNIFHYDFINKTLFVNTSLNEFNYEDIDFINSKEIFLNNNLNQYLEKSLLIDFDLYSLFSQSNCYKNNLNKISKNLMPSPASFGDETVNAKFLDILISCDLIKKLLSDFNIFELFKYLISEKGILKLRKAIKVAINNFLNKENIYLSNDADKKYLFENLSCIKYEHDDYLLNNEAKDENISPNKFNSLVSHSNKDFLNISKVDLIKRQKTIKNIKNTGIFTNSENNSTSYDVNCDTKKRNLKNTTSYMERYDKKRLNHASANNQTNMNDSIEMKPVRCSDGVNMHEYPFNKQQGASNTKIFYINFGSATTDLESNDDLSNTGANIFKKAVKNKSSNKKKNINENKIDINLNKINKKNKHNTVKTNDYNIDQPNNITTPTYNNLKNMHDISLNSSLSSERLYNTPIDSTQCLSVKKKKRCNIKSCENNSLEEESNVLSEQKIVKHFYNSKTNDQDKKIFNYNLNSLEIQKFLGNPLDSAIVDEIQKFIIGDTASNESNSKNAIQKTYDFTFKCTNNLFIYFKYKMISQLLKEFNSNLLLTLADLQILCCKNQKCTNNCINKLSHQLEKTPILSLDNLSNESFDTMEQIKNKLYCNTTVFQFNKMLFDTDELFSIYKNFLKDNKNLVSYFVDQCERKYYRNCYKYLCKNGFSSDIMKKVKITSKINDKPNIKASNVNNITGTGSFIQLIDYNLMETVNKSIKLKHKSSKPKNIFYAVGKNGQFWETKIRKRKKL
ncbi:hypothetical protein EDEG_02427 [Edhazardia aedis USNM 41457]|uniref:Uncharacterized protein n=1 Tax=Edhazardia aedis (strain USNM 41457) TaxID=1003232 RepID=J9DPE4_EDHAE|nr:hypothetical protein EDEG_02427 [Edhazardia aedis USNM 41457]|eukprot:EJW03212.1 hypothetical protein EDEG_02427 [Edhazardia aedis USNM 41457]